ncbi:MAG: metalloregulator ArsR/SmtB family transcription factor [Rhodospirillaceae bacterium]|nr:metalloregulator ArsR/SmtB family transcription factor [Rhodospirillaceae bacterium]
MDYTVEMLRAVAEPTRLRLLALLGAGGELSVSELVRVLGQSQPRLSRHLKILTKAGLLERLSEGSWAFYRTRQIEPQSDNVRTILSLLPKDDGVIAADRAHLDEIKSARAQAAQEYFQHHAAEWDRMAQLNINEDAVIHAAEQMLPLGKAEKILDIGTGTGKMLELFAPKVKTAVGVDLNAEMLQVARANMDSAGLSNVSLRQSDIYTLPYESRSFDAVTCHQVLHFLDRPSQAIVEAARILKPGGYMLIADLAPHDVEDLRKKHAHRRLGFEDSEIKLWFAKAAMRPQATVHLKGNPLSVTLWLAQKGKNDDIDKQKETA